MEVTSSPDEPPEAGCPPGRAVAVNARCIPRSQKKGVGSSGQVQVRMRVSGNLAEVQCPLVPSEVR